MADEGIRPELYPYTIPPPRRPDAATLKRLDPWHVQEFFRVELLLRSKTVIDLYRAKGISPTSHIALLIRFGFGWDVLQGDPHHCLKPRAGPMGAIPGLAIWETDKLAQVAAFLNVLLQEMRESEKQGLVKALRARFIGLWVDPALPPETVLRALGPELRRRHKPSEATPRRRKWRKFDVSTWLDYLACHDLRITEGLTYGQIAQRVYGDGGAKPRDLAEKAVARVQRYIRAAERNEWPPKQR